MQRIEDYALIGDTHTAALVGRDGSIDWLCLPRFDSPACFAALLGDAEHGRWLIAPRRRGPRVAAPLPRRHARARDGVPDRGRRGAGHRLHAAARAPASDLVRVVEGLEGRVPMRMELRAALRLRPDRAVGAPRGRRRCAVAGPDARRRCARRVDAARRGPHAPWRNSPSPRASGCRSSSPGFTPTTEPPLPVDPMRRRVEDTAAWWRAWCGALHVPGAVARRRAALADHAEGADLRARPAASSRPPRPRCPSSSAACATGTTATAGCATRRFTLCALLAARLHRGGRRLARLAAARGGRRARGDADHVRRSRRAPAHRVRARWLPGYEGSKPVRVGNAASEQFQLDVYGELMDAMHAARARRARARRRTPGTSQRALLDFLESDWSQPDEGIWEVRGPRRHFTHSKVMAWVAFDRAVKSVEEFGLDGPVERWKRRREEIHPEVLRARRATRCAARSRSPTARRRSTRACC